MKITRKGRTELLKQMIALVNAYQHNGALLTYADIGAAGINMRSGQHWLNQMVRLGLVERPRPGAHRPVRQITLADFDGNRRSPISPDRFADPEHDQWLTMVKQQRAEYEQRRALERRHFKTAATE